MNAHLLTIKDVRSRGRGAQTKVSRVDALVFLLPFNLKSPERACATSHDGKELEGQDAVEANGQLAFRDEDLYRQGVYLL